MGQNKETEAAFTKIINNAPSAVLRKAAKKYWEASLSDSGASAEIGTDFETAIKSISIDYRTPALKCLDEFETCKEDGGDLNDCYSLLAISLATRVVHG